VAVAKSQAFEYNSQTKAGAMTIEELLAKIQSYYPDANLERIRRAYDLAATAHRGQLRATGDPYITHCVEVTNILADLYLDEDSPARCPRRHDHLARNDSQRVWR
jgi:(p)ppGpp synthase/HD superfamily hydrolase